MLEILDGPTIPEGESLSDEIDCSAGRIVRITVPQEYSTGGNLSFQVSTDGNLFNDLFNARGEEILVVASPNTAIYMGGEPWVESVVFLKIRSGSRNHPVPQREDCKFAIAVDTEQSTDVASGTSGSTHHERGD